MTLVEVMLGELEQIAKSNDGKNNVRYFGTIDGKEVDVEIVSGGTS